MPLGVERRDVVLHDGAAAAAALGREHVKVVVLAVRLAVLLVEAVLAELLAALRAEEVLRVPRLLQRRHAFLWDKKSSPPKRRVKILVLRSEMGFFTSRMGPLQ